MATTVQTIVNSAQQDVMNAIGTSHPMLLDYTNRISLDLLRATKWDFLVSDVKRFLTQQGVTNYWIGATGANPAGTYDTGLNLTDVKWVKHGSVYDRSNFRGLGSLTEAPVSAILAYTDSTSRPGRPAVYRNNVDTPSILNIYPAPDQQNNQAPQPEAPILSTTSGGSLPARVYFVTVTFVDGLGNESTAPLTAQVFIPANKLVVVAAPSPYVTQNDAGVPYSKYNVYASSTFQLPQQTTLQTNSPITIPTSWTEPTSGLTTSGNPPPSFNASATLNGYLIEFRYYQALTQLTTFGQNLQVPDQYSDIVVSGVNWLSCKFLGRMEDAKEWLGTYKMGLTSMVHDRNQQNRFSDYISPDPSTLGGMLPTIETIDLNMLQP